MGSQRRQGQDKERLRLTAITITGNKDKAIMLGGKLMVLNTTDQIRELQTMIRDKVTSRSEFKFVADRLIRMVVEEGLNQLPYQVGYRGGHPNRLQVFWAQVWKR